MRRKISRALTDTPVTAFLTLTCSRRAHPDPDQAFLTLSEAVNKLFKRIRRYRPAAQTEFFLVWERTKAGWPHAHVLLRAPFLPQQWLSDQWRGLVSSPIIDIRAVSDARAAASYIAKYLSKDPQAPAGMKRYRSSRSFFAGQTLSQLLRPHQPGLWRVVRLSPAELAQRWWFAGRRVHLSNSGEVLSGALCPSACFCGFRFQNAEPLTCIAA